MLAESKNKGRRVTSTAKPAASSERGQFPLFAGIALSCIRTGHSLGGGLRKRCSLFLWGKNKPPSCSRSRDARSA